VVRPLDRVDAVDLDEPEPADERQQVRAPRRTDRRLRQGVAIEEDASCGAVANARAAHRDASAYGESIRLKVDVNIGIWDP
jgi:hypothetical protein